MKQTNNNGKKRKFWPGDIVKLKNNKEHFGHKGIVEFYWPSVNRSTSFYSVKCKKCKKLLSKIPTTLIDLIEKETDYRKRKNGVAI